MSGMGKGGGQGRGRMGGSGLGIGGECRCPKLWIYNATSSGCAMQSADMLKMRV
ncbi:hypothetical protein C5S35_11865 [Candidatus Methanophagaceae archaeon]|nr:hypothetical protein C5S35_11865 [Methanophagales archaeon]